MKNFRLTAARDNNSVAMVMTDTETGAERVEVYPAEQTYPLLTDPTTTSWETFLSTFSMWWLALALKV